MTAAHLSWSVRTEQAQETLEEILHGAALTARVDALQEHIRGAGAMIQLLEAKVFAPGIWRCAKCALRLVASTGRPQGCLNNCGPMWRVSWAEEALSASELAEKELLAKRSAVTDRDELIRIIDDMHAGSQFGSVEDLQIFETIKQSIGGKANG